MFFLFIFKENLSPERQQFSVNIEFRLNPNVGSKQFQLYLYIKQPARSKTVKCPFFFYSDTGQLHWQHVCASGLLSLAQYVPVTLSPHNDLYDFTILILFRVLACPCATVYSYFGWCVNPLCTPAISYLGSLRSPKNVAWFNYRLYFI